jgi:predicted esterase
MSHPNPNPKSFPATPIGVRRRTRTARRRHFQWLWTVAGLATLALLICIGFVVRLGMNQRWSFAGPAATGGEALDPAASLRAASASVTGLSRIQPIGRESDEPDDAIFFASGSEVQDSPDSDERIMLGEETASPFGSDATQADHASAGASPGVSGAVSSVDKNRTADAEMPEGSAQRTKPLEMGESADPAARGARRPVPRRETERESPPNETNGPQPSESRDNGRGGLRYDLALPPGGSRGAPIALFLHGTGGVRAVWNRWANAALARGYIVCLPVASGSGVGDPKSGNRGNDSIKRWSEPDVAKLRDLARGLVQSLGADPRHVVLFGYSNGGFYAQETGLRHPETFSAIVSIGGGCNVFQFPPDSKRMGVYMIHGTADHAVPIHVARVSLDRLKGGGLTNVVLREHPDRGHELFEDEIPAVFAWLEVEEEE